MVKHLSLYILLLVSFLCTSCVSETEFADNPSGNFEALWKIMDEHYCFFTEKGVDWDDVHARYARQIDATMTEEQLLEVLGNMLAELKDGHVNLFTSLDIGRYWGFHEDYPANYNDSIIRHYLGTDYRISNGMSYRVLDDNIGYVRCPSFSSTLGASGLDNMLIALAPCRGLIIDLRQNGGGLVTSAEEFAACFTNETLTVGYMRHKTGRGHEDFSGLSAQTLRPREGVRWQKPVVVLTNRSVFSAANEFVKYMKCCPHVTIVGDRTGGGAGLPFSNELPNGWSVRFSACPMYDKDKRSTEDGIDPDVKAALSPYDVIYDRDTIIETARRLLGASHQ